MLLPEPRAPVDTSSAVLAVHVAADNHQNNEEGTPEVSDKILAVSGETW